MQILSNLKSSRICWPEESRYGRKCSKAQKPKLVGVKYLMMENIYIPFIIHGMQNTSDLS